MMKKRLSLLLVLAMIAAPLCAGAEPAGEQAYYSKAWLGGQAYGYNTDAAVLVLTNDPARKTLTPEQVAGEIRFCPFDEAAGLYAVGREEPAGDRAEILSLSDSRTKYSVRLNEPGKYILSGAEYYLFDPKVPAQAALRAELDGVAVSSTQEDEKKTAKAIHDWAAGRVSPVFPEEDAECLAAVCADPMNALVTGFACRDAYARLNSLLLGAAGIRCLEVSGTADGEAASWNLCRLNSVWCWTDIARDDLNDKKAGKYLALDDKAIGKDHELCPADETFTAALVRQNAYEALGGGMLDPGQVKYYPEGARNLEMIVTDGPSYVVGGSATVSFHFESTIPAAERLKGLTPAEYLQQNMGYAPWDEEGQFYFFSVATPKEQEYLETHPECCRDPRELITVEEAAEDMSSFTITFHEPGRYSFYFALAETTFYLISPDQAAPAAMAAEMDGVIAKAKTAKTEKEAAKQIFNWIRKKVKYNYTAYKWEEHPEYTVRDMETAGDAVGALIYGKCVCTGYAAIFDLMMRQAGMRDVRQVGDVQPDYDSHEWNAARLDGEWTLVDVTWGRFAWTQEQMGKDHSGCLDDILDHFCFRSAFDLLADQLEEDYRSLSAVPPALRFLPASMDAYGFPAKAPAFLTPEVTIEGRTVTVKVSQPARIRIAGLGKDRKPVMGYLFFSETGARTFAAEIRTDFVVQVDIMTDPQVARNSQWILLEYEGGELVNESYRYAVAEKAGQYPGYAKGYRYLAYDGQMNPVSAGWHLSYSRPLFYTSNILDLQVFFGEEGRVARYAASFQTNIAEQMETSWEGTADRPLTALNGQEVEDPARADRGLWEPVWFE